MVFLLVTVLILIRAVENQEVIQDHELMKICLQIANREILWNKKKRLSSMSMVYTFNLVLCDIFIWCPLRVYFALGMVEHTFNPNTRSTWSLQSVPELQRLYNRSYLKQRQKNKKQLWWHNLETPAIRQTRQGDCLSLKAIWYTHWVWWQTGSIARSHLKKQIHIYKYYTKTPEG